MGKKNNNKNNKGRRVFLRIGQHITRIFKKERNEKDISSVHLSGNIVGSLDDVNSPNITNVDKDTNLSPKLFDRAYSVDDLGNEKPISHSPLIPNFKNELMAKLHIAPKTKITTGITATQSSGDSFDRSTDAIKLIQKPSLSRVSSVKDSNSIYSGAFQRIALSKQRQHRPPTRFKETCSIDPTPQKSANSLAPSDTLDLIVEASPNSLTTENELSAKLGVSQNDRKPMGTGGASPQGDLGSTDSAGRYADTASANQDTLSAPLLIKELGSNHASAILRLDLNKQRQHRPPSRYLSFCTGTDFSPVCPLTPDVQKVTAEESPIPQTVANTCKPLSPVVTQEKESPKIGLNTEMSTKLFNKLPPLFNTAICPPSLVTPQSQKSPQLIMCPLRSCNDGSDSREHTSPPVRSKAEESPNNATTLVSLRKANFSKQLPTSESSLKISESPISHNAVVKSEYTKPNTQFASLPKDTTADLELLQETKESGQLASERSVRSSRVLDLVKAYQGCLD